MPNPQPPLTFVANGFIGDDQLILNSANHLDGPGIIYTTDSHGSGNIIGDYSEGTPNIILTGANGRTFIPGNFSISEITGQVTTPGGTQQAPTALPSISISNISGLIGPENDQQFYSFDWSGGLFSATAAIQGADPADEFLFFILGVGTNDFRADLNTATLFAGTLSGYLARGNYAIGIAATVPVDPAFTIQFATPVGPAAAVPEPANWALMIVGMGLVGGALRRRQKTARRVRLA